MKPLFRYPRPLLLLLPLCLLFLAPGAWGEAVSPRPADLVREGQAIDLDSPLYRELFAELVAEHGFARRELEEIFTGLTINRRVLELMDAQWEAQPYHRYAPRLLTWWNVGNGRVLLARHRELLARIEAEFGVEREIVVAIWGVESNYGSTEGAFNIFQTMNTLFAAYPRRSDFYRQQLIELLLLSRENGLDPRAIRGSYGGAFGQAQFIPSSFRAYAVDFDGSGRRDIQGSVPDVLASIANYLRHFGWRFGAPLYAELGDRLGDPRLEEARLAARAGLLPREEIEALQGVALPPVVDNRPLRVVGLELADGGWRYLAAYPNFQAITHWNNSYRYAMAVIQLAEKFRAE
ncbi:lytic transglycosylase domain-containing protein [Desulfurivibrio sp. D14AmB]|uniref:lytic murein transglycosylase n=1 Tax=Desulfurivibrio sp. D14AmB TaxID=3374370 RepID=UPI00376EDF48